MTIVLQVAQEQVTLDDALLAMSTFANGCDFRLRIEGDKFFLEYGCYGVHPNLVQGKQRLLHLWLTFNKGDSRELKSPAEVAHETIDELLSRKPCQRCGGFRFKVPKI